MKRRTLPVFLLSALMLLCTACSGAFPAPSAPESAAAQPSAVPAENIQPSIEGSSFVPYCFSLLNAEDQDLYLKILSAYQNAAADFSSPIFDQDRLVKIANYVLLDHPEIFWYTGDIRIITHSKGDDVVGMDLRFGYEISPEELEGAKAQVEAAAQECLSAIDPTLSDYDKIKAVYDWLIRRTAYVSAEECQTLYTVMANGEGVCSGYARSMQYLLHKLDIPCLFVSGTAGKQNHAWNLVMADGEYYYLDATMGDPVATETAEPDPDYVSYAFFCITTEDLLRTHTPDETIPLPECTATACNYFYKNERYLTAYDPQKIYDILYQSVQNGENAAIRFSDSGIFSDAYSQLFFQDGIFPMLQEISNQIGLIDPSSIDYRKEGAGDVLVICPVFL